MAPSGCTQYYYGNTLGAFQSYNYDNSVQLANQFQKVCFRSGVA
jgi:hypothetical protein